MLVDIGLQKKERKLISDALARFLADTMGLYAKTHGYHWNVTGPSFKMLHDLFHEQYNELLEAADEIAERIRALGFYSPASFHEFIQLMSLEEEKGIPEAMDMIRQLLMDHELMVRRGKEIFHISETAHDPVTSDLMVQRMEKHAHQAWILRSHLEGA